MTDKTATCEWGDCDRPAQWSLVFTAPTERVDYCGQCIEAAKLDLEYEAVVPA